MLVTGSQDHFHYYYYCHYYYNNYNCITIDARYVSTEDMCNVLIEQVGDS